MEQINTQDVLDAIKSLVSGSGVITNDTPLLSSGIIDSLGVAELADTLNSAFACKLEVDQLGFDNADTAEQLTKLVNSNR